MFDITQTHFDATYGQKHLIVFDKPLKRSFHWKEKKINMGMMKVQMKKFSLFPNQALGIIKKNPRKVLGNFHTKGLNFRGTFCTIPAEKYRNTM